VYKRQVGGLLGAAYLLPIVFRAFLWRSPQFPSFGEASPLMVIPLVVTAMLTLALGIAPDVPLRFLELAEGVAYGATGGRP
jgi:multicomponent Na+:H+ antiporter subunit D